MPHSIFTGRPWPQPGEPLFLQEDTDLAVALAEEERDTCRSCGLPKAWCRDSKTGRVRFEVVEDYCWPAYHIAARRESRKDTGVTAAATQMSVRFRPGHEPDAGAGLGLSSSEDDEQRAEGRREQQ